ncbi:MAG: hypothetical protein M0R03_15665 [Novosphingobium sp.]|nr:hypothetical protein [Novosphingobium sp.]
MNWREKLLWAAELNYEAVAEMFWSKVYTGVQQKLPNVTRENIIEASQRFIDLYDDNQRDDPPEFNRFVWHAYLGFDALIQDTIEDIVGNWPVYSQEDIDEP